MPLRSTTLIALAAMMLAAPAAAQAPPPAPVTPELVAAAKSEGKVVFYTTLDLQVGAMLGKSFETKYPGVAVAVERSGAERIFQRIAQEEASGIHAADVVESTDIAHFLAWKSDRLLAAYVPADLARWPQDERDADGLYATSRVTLTVMGYNTRLLAPEAAPKGYRDLLDAKWRGKIVKAHPGYSGNILVATLAIKDALGWAYFEKLGQQRVMQVQSSTEPPKKLALGERPVMFDGNEYNMLILKDEHAPVEIVYPAEGTPYARAIAGMMRQAPHPAAARLFISYLFSREAQQILVDVAAMRSLHPEAAERPGRVPLAAIKLLKTDPGEQQRSIEEVKRRYAQYFGT